MKKQIELSLSELVTLAIERLVELNKLDVAETDVEWNLSLWTPQRGYVVISQED